MNFDQALETFANLDDFLAGRGLPVKKDRWREAVLMVQKAKEQRERVERGGPPQPIANYMQALFEALEIHNIMRAFSNDSSQALKDKLARALCGPLSPLHEQPKNSEARNAMFELALAADWKNGGADLELGEPDIRIRFEGATFLVECKRPFYAHSVRANIKDAARQLERAVTALGQENSFGVVAISLSRVFSSGDHFCSAPEGQGLRVINDALVDLIKENGRDWKFTRFHDRVVAVMLHLTAPWDIEGQALIHLSTCKLFRAGRNENASRLFDSSIQKLYPH